MDKGKKKGSVVQGEASWNPNLTVTVLPMVAFKGIIAKLAWWAAS